MHQSFTSDCRILVGNTGGERRTDKGLSALPLINKSKDLQALLNGGQYITGSERAKRPMDDLPEDTLHIPRDADVTDLVPNDVLATEPVPSPRARERGPEDPRR